MKNVTFSPLVHIAGGDATGRRQATIMDALIENTFWPVRGIPSAGLKLTEVIRPSIRASLVYIWYKGAAPR